MDERFRESYAAIYDELTRRPGPIEDVSGPLRPTPSTIRDYIETASASLPDRELREDAKAFLAVNFSQLIVAPLLAGGERAVEVGDDVRSDIALLVEDASARSQEAQVSAHQVVDALSKSWGRLQIARYGLWENTI